MAREHNRIAVKTIKLTLAWPLYEYLDRAIKRGFYGASYTAAAERMIEERIQLLINEKKIEEMTSAELSKPPASAGRK